MRILEDYEELVGKKIVFSHMAQFAEQITLATEDRCVLMATFDFDDEEYESNIRVLSPGHVQMTLNNHEWLREELGRLGVFDLEEYKEQERIKQEKEREVRRLEREEREQSEYERLKKKFEGN